MNQQQTTAGVFHRSSKLLQDGDIDGWLALCDNNVVFEFPFAPPRAPSRIEGKAALAHHMRACARTMKSPKLERLKIHVTEDPTTIVAEMAVQGSSGQTRLAIAVVTVHDGLITGYRDYWNPLDVTGAKAGPRAEA